MALSHRDVRRILEILDHASQLESLDVRIGDFVLRARKPGAAALSPLHAAEATTSAPAAASPTPTQPAEIAEPVVPEGMAAVRAPMVGTFYRRPRPEDPSFVEEGSRVEAGAALCLLEAMKLFNTVAAPVAGRVLRIFAHDGKLVQHGELLMIIEPEAIKA